MTGRGSKQKGNVFERTVAKMILKAAGPKFKASDCYRTPLSGGHPIASSGDLVLSRRLAKTFPFVVECKHRKTFHMRRVFFPGETFGAYLDQTIKAAKKERRPPLLVIRGNGTQVLCVTDEEYVSEMPYLTFYHGGVTWAACLFKTFLARWFPPSPEVV